MLNASKAYLRAVRSAAETPKSAEFRAGEGKAAMPNRSKPKYRKHKASGKGIVTLPDRSGKPKDYLLPGAFNSKESKAEYARLIQLWQNGVEQLPATARPFPGPKCSFSSGNTPKLIIGVPRKCSATRSRTRKKELCRSGSSASNMPKKIWAGFPRSRTGSSTCAFSPGWPKPVTAKLPEEKYRKPDRAIAP